MVKITSAAAGALVLATAVAAQPSINTPPSITQCQPVSLQWSNASGTVRIFILPAGQVSAAPIANLPDQTGASGSYPWTVNIPANTNITIAVSDATGTTGYASPRVVLPSSDSSCLNAAASSSSSSSGAAAGGAGASSTSASSSAASTSRASSSSSAPSSSSSAASSSATRASSTSSGSASSTSAAPAQTSSRAANAAAAFSPATAGLSVLAAVGALLPFL